MDNGGVEELTQIPGMGLCVDKISNPETLIPIAIGTETLKLPKTLIPKT